MAVAHQTVNAVLFDLDTVAVEGRAVVFEVLQQVLKSEGLALTAAHFSRYAAWADPACYLSELLAELGAPKHGPEAVARAVQEKLAARMAEERKLGAGLSKLIDVAQERGMAVAGISRLPQDEAKALAERTGLTARGVQVLGFASAEKTFPGADAWLKTAKLLGKSPRGCMAVASGVIACKAALFAGMRCLAVPDAFTAHHDFSGVDCVLDDWKNMPPGEILSLILPAGD